MPMTTTQNPIGKVLQTMEIPLENTVNLEGQIAIARTGIERVDSLRKGRSFFAFEDVDADVAEQKLKLQRQLRKLEMAKRDLLEYDPSFLSWRKKDTKLPAFMILTPNTKEFTIQVEPYNDMMDSGGHVDYENTEYRISPRLPDAIVEHFEETIHYLARLSAKSHHWEQIQISAEYKGGYMPPDLRAKVEDLIKSRTFDQIYIVAEAPEWKVDYLARSDKDPLVFGWDDNTSQMFLIGSYNPTTLEDYVRIQFAK